MGTKISAVTPKTAAVGTEVIPIADSGTPKSVTAAVLKTYVVDAIEAIAAATAVTGADSVFILQGGVLKPADIDLIAQHAIDTVWGKTSETVIDGADLFPLKDGGTTEKTVTATLLASYILSAIRTSVLNSTTLGAAAALSSANLITVIQDATPTKLALDALSEFVRATIEGSILDVSNLSSAGTLVDADLALVTQTTTGKKVTLANVAAYVQSKIGSALELAILDISDLGAAGTLADSDLALVTQSSTGKKVALSTLATYVQSKIAASLEAAILDFTSLASAGTLADADTMAVTQTATGKKATLDTLSTYFQGKIGTAIKPTILDVSTLNTATLASTDLIGVTQTTTAKKVALSALSTYLYTSLSAYVTALDAVTTPEDADIFYAIRSGTGKKVTLSQLKAVLGSTIAPSTTTEGKIPRWGSAQKTLTDGLTFRTDLRAQGTADDLSVVSEKAVRAALTPATLTGVGVAMRFGASATEGLEVFVVDTTITLGSTSGVSIAEIPANAVLKSVQANVATAATAGGTSVKIGIGIASDPDSYGLSSALTQDLKIDTMVSPVVNAAAIPILAYPCATSGAIGDTAFSAGTLRVRIVYEQLNSLGDA